MTSRTARNLSDNSVISTENYTYDAAGNVTDAPDSCFEYDTNNRLIAFEGRAVSYDPDGNMLSNGSLSCTYDSANRLLTAGGHTYTYNAEDVRIRNLCADADTTYTYDTNGKLSRLLTKTTNGITLNRYAYANGNPVSNIDPFGLSAERSKICRDDYLIYLGITPWGTPNTHVTEHGTYWKERWFGPDGRAVKDRHWTDHGSSKSHPNPHDQDWDWSDPEHPDLNDPKAVDDPPPQPQEEGEEPWSPNEKGSDSPDNSKDPNKIRRSSPSVGDIIIGGAIIVGSGLLLAWLIGNDVTAVGGLDDAAIAPVAGWFGYGLTLLGGV